MARQVLKGARLLQLGALMETAASKNGRGCGSDVLAWDHRQAHLQQRVLNGS